MVQLLADAGADLSSKVNIITAVTNKDSAMLYWLLKLKESPCEISANTVIDYCLKNGDSQCLRALLQNVSSNIRTLEIGVYSKALDMAMDPTCQKVIEKYL